MAISDGALIPGQPSGPAAGLAARTRGAVPVAVAALPCLGAASATVAEAMPMPFTPPTRHTARHDPLTSARCAPTARPSYPYARLPAKHPHGGREHCRPGHCRVPAWRKSARTSRAAFSSGLLDVTLPVDSAGHVNPALIVAWVRLRDAWWWWFGMAEAEAEADEVAANRELWTQANSEYADEHALRAWAAEDITWGIFDALPI